MGAERLAAEETGDIRLRGAGFLGRAGGRAGPHPPGWPPCTGWPLSQATWGALKMGVDTNVVCHMVSLSPDPTPCKGLSCHRSTRVENLP